MTQAFDPYRIWLGIPPEEQPPNHYRLLGIGLFESDPEVVSNAADRQMAHVRTFQTGPHSALSQKLLNELAAARVTLLDSTRRAAYEEQLRRKLASEPAVSPSTPSVSSEPVPKVSEHRPPSQDKDDASEALVAADSQPAGLAAGSWVTGQYLARRKRASWQGPLAMGAIAVLGVALLGWLLMQRTEPPNPPGPTKEVSETGSRPSSQQLRVVPPHLPRPANRTPSPPAISPTNKASGPATTPKASAQGESASPTEPVRPSPAVAPADVSPKPVAPPSTPAPSPAPVSVPPSLPPVASELPKVDINALAKVKGFDCRRDPGRALLLASLGGNDASQKAVEEAVHWLAERQLPEGSWSFDRDGAGELSAPHAATALAILTLVGAGPGEDNVKHHLAAFKGHQYLAKQMKSVTPAAGSLFENSPAELPSHPMATVALCELAATSQNKQVLKTARAAINLVVMSQNEDGGWASTLRTSEEEPPKTSDMFATGWSVAALATARMARLEVPESTLERAGVFLNSLETPDRLGYRRAPSLPLDPDATAIGFLCRVYLNWQADKPELRQYADQLGQTGPRTDGGFDFNYHATLLLRHHGGSAWKAWNPAIRDFLLAQQIRGGPEKGSWYFRGLDPLASQGGRLYCTAMAALILESYYRYPPPPSLLEGP